jgi:Fe-S-cluster containining protein
MIHLRGSMPAAYIPSERVHFAFASGRFAYDCVGCQAHCCRGFGYELRVGSELRAHVRRNPSLVVFLEPVKPTGDDRVIVKNCPPQCFFLADDNRCAIHVESGFAAKPETCRLFPFNVIRSAAGHVIVSPHLSLCPLSVTSAGVRSQLSDHELLLAEMNRAGIHKEVPAAEPAICDVSRLLAIEEAIIAAGDAPGHLSDPQSLGS